MANANSDISVHSAQDNARLQAQLAGVGRQVDGAACILPTQSKCGNALQRPVHHAVLARAVGGAQLQAAEVEPSAVDVGLQFCGDLSCVSGCRADLGGGRRFGWNVHEFQCNSACWSANCQRDCL